MDGFCHRLSPALVNEGWLAILPISQAANWVINELTVGLGVVMLL